MARIFADSNHPVFSELHALGVNPQSPLTKGADTLNIGVVNLMPKPVDPVRDFGLLFARYAARDINLIDFTPAPETITTDPERLAYRQTHLLPLSTIGRYNPDAIIITGFGKEDVPFESLKFWNEITDTLDYAKAAGIPVLASCWASHAALHHYHGVKKTWDMSDKISGVFNQSVVSNNHPLTKGIENNFTMPVSRYGRSDDSAILNNPALTILAESAETGASVVTDGNTLYLTGHPEYPAEALAGEYQRDLAAGTPHLKLPHAVFTNNNPAQGVQPATWEQNSGRLIANWVEAVHQTRQEKRDNFVFHFSRQPAPPRGLQYA